MQDTLLFFTETYPYGKGESFIENEIGYLCKNFKKVIVVPCQPIDELDTARSMPSNAVPFPIGAISKGRLLSYLPGNIFSIAKALIYDLFSTRKEFVKKIFSIKRLLHSLLWGTVINRKLDSTYDLTNASYYSYWMNNGAVSLALRKIANNKVSFVTRAHGFDLYHNRSDYGIVVLQQLICRYAMHILPVSRDGERYLKVARPGFASKFKHCYLGVPDRGINEMSLDDKEINLVSCSFLVPIKRVSLIVKALMLLKFKVNWVHLGGGPQMEEIAMLCKQLPPNISYQLTGDVENSVIIDFYRSHSVDLFVHLSETEGIPVAIMEAVSFGIPVLATNVGGVGELINEHTGILVKEDILLADIATEIEDFFSSNKNSIEFRQSVRNYWNNNFNAERNYNNFIANYLLDKK